MGWLSNLFSGAEKVQPEHVFDLDSFRRLVVESELLRLRGGLSFPEMESVHDVEVPAGGRDDLELAFEFGDSSLSIAFPPESPGIADEFGRLEVVLVGARADTAQVRGR
jgi:hypothetical protein